jgi:hypothetical protein
LSVGYSPANLEVMAEQRSRWAVTIVAADCFDRLAASVDEPDDAPGLARAGRAVRRRSRIAAAYEVPRGRKAIEIRNPTAGLCEAYSLL